MKQEAHYMLCVDPNLRGCGVALFHGDKLVLADYVPNPQKEGRGYKAHVELGIAVAQWRSLKLVEDFELLVEMPVAYGTVHKKGDPNDILDVTGVGAAVATAVRLTKYGYAVVTHVRPSDWKGQLEKRAMLERIKSKLSDEERATCVKQTSADTEDMLDAVGIGLWRLGRLNKKVFHGVTED